MKKNKFNPKKESKELDKILSKLEEKLDVNGDNKIDLEDSTTHFKNKQWVYGIVALVLWLIANFLPMILKLLGIV